MSRWKKTYQKWCLRENLFSYCSCETGCLHGTCFKKTLEKLFHKLLLLTVSPFRDLKFLQNQITLTCQTVRVAIYSSCGAPWQMDQLSFEI